VVSTPNPSVFGQTVSFTATVTAIGAGAGTPTGSVTFKADGTSIGSANLSLGVATFTTSTLAVGTHAIQATYAGDTSFHGSLGGGPAQVVNKASTTTAVISPQNPITIGQPVTFTATVSPAAPGSGTPTGTVTFHDGGGALGVATLSGGIATLTITYVGTISDTVTTTYPGDSSFNGSSGSLTGNPQVVNPAGTTTTLISSQNPSTFNQAVTFTATVTQTGGPGTPTGTVTFKDGATTLNTVNLVGGVAALTTSTLTPGSHSLTATYNGNAIFTGSNGSFTQSVGTIGTSTALASTPNPSFAGQTVTFTATVTKSGGSGTPTGTGTVTFKDGGGTLGTGTLNGAGVASFATSALAVGSHSISAVYGGDANFSVSTSAALSQAVNLPADSIKLRALQIQVSKLEAQGSGQAISGAIDGAISDGFSESGPPVSASDTGVHFNFMAELPQQEKKETFEERAGNAFSALGYDGDPMLKAPTRVIPREWFLWADVRGTDWSTNLQTGDIRGGQTNGSLGLTHKLSPDFLVGAFGGMEIFNY
jgi:hypothetical protein